MTPVLSIRGLAVQFRTRGGVVGAVDDVDLEVLPGRCRALIGASGSGKTATMSGALGLLPSNGRVVRGHAILDGVDLVAASARVRRGLHGRRVGVVCQDPQTSLHPSYTIGSQLVEAIRVHARGLDATAARRRAVELLDRVQVPRAQARLGDHPHQWSGGMQQRAMIAMAMAHDPALLVADEPTTALDVTIQAQILELLDELRRERGMALVLVTHDLGIVREFATDVTVMDHGRVVEQGDVASVCLRPAHAVTRELLDVGR